MIILSEKVSQNQITRELREPPTTHELIPVIVSNQVNHLY
jgi:hypothetical protein